MDRLPELDFAIVGAPKCGTTSLFRWLDAHPETQGTNVKETYYFSDPGHFTDPRNELFEVGLLFEKAGWSGYEQFFTPPRGARKRFEATATNLYQDTARTVLAEIEPQPLIVVALRCPADQIRSTFYFFRNNAGSIDPSLEFPEYTAALLGDGLETIASRVRNEWVRWYLGSALSTNRYAQWLDRWRESFPAERIAIVRFDDIRDRPREVLSELCSRTGIDPGFFDSYELEAFNPTVAQPVVRQSRLAAISRLVPPQLLRPYRRLRKRWRQRRSGSLAGPSAADRSAMQELGGHFGSANQDLQERYGVDVSGWFPRP